jgi:predicted nucleotidyltransferase
MQISDLQIQKLGERLMEKYPEISFAYIFGSASEKDIAPPSDIDIAIYSKKEKPTPELIAGIIGITEEQFPGFRCDLTLLNTSGSLIAMEALRGRIIFIRKQDHDIHADFYSMNCRLSEYDLAWMKKQLQYRGYEVQWNN